MVRGLLKVMGSLEVRCLLEVRDLLEVRGLLKVRGLLEARGLLEVGRTGPQGSRRASHEEKAEEPSDTMGDVELPLAAMFGVVHIHSKEESPEI